MSQTRSTVNTGLTPGGVRRVVENDEYTAFTARILRAAGRRIAAGDVEALPALAGLVVPMLAGGIAAGDREQVRRTASALLGWALLVLTPLAVVIALVSGPIAGLLLAGHSHAEIALAARFLVVFAPQVVLYGIGIVLATLVLMVVFGGLVAALFPIAVAVVSSLIALGVAVLIGHVVVLSFFIVNITTVLGLAVGIDYSLLILQRYRE